MERIKLILIGGGGHCKACIDVIEQTNQFEIWGILDQPKLVGTNVLGYKIIGTDTDITEYITEGCHFLITIGQIKTASIRKRVFQDLEMKGALFATIISKEAYVSKYAKIGKGTIVMHNSIVNAGAEVGENCILNTGCGIEHDVFIGNHTHISTQAVINGDCVIEDEVFIGSNATVSSQITVAKNAVIGAGAIIYVNVEYPGVYVGNSIRKK